MVYGVLSVGRGEACPGNSFYARTDADENRGFIKENRSEDTCDAEGIDWTGRCSDDGHARWCEDGVVKDRDCWLCDQDCGWTGEALGYYCI